MPIKTNSFYSDPALGAGIENLGRAIFGDPETIIKGAVAKAQGNYYNARAAGAEVDTDRKVAAHNALRSIGTNIGSAIFGPVEAGPNPDGSAGVPTMRSREQILAALPNVLNSAGVAYADKPAALGDIFALIGAMSGDDALARQGMVATGKTPGKDFALSPERADNIRGQEYGHGTNLENLRQAGANSRNTYTTDQNRAGAYDREVLQQTGAMERAQMVDERSLAAIFDPNSNQAVWSTKKDAVGKPAASVTAQKDRYVVSPNENDDGFSYRPVKPGLPAPTPAGERPKNPPKMTVNDMGGIETRIAEALAISKDQWGDMIASLDPTDRAGLSTTISNAWATSGGSATDAIAAGQKYLTDRYDIAKGKVYGINVGKKPGKEPASPAAKGGAPAPQAGAKQTPQQKIIDEANAAIAKGANPEAVRARLEKMGIKLLPST